MQIISDINRLQPGLQTLAKQFLELANERSLKIKIYETFRTEQRQLALRQAGHSKIYKSMHMFGAAFDVVFDGHAPWGGHHPWNSLGKIGRDLGLFWGGDWESFVDRPHFQCVEATKYEQKKIYNGWQIAEPFPVLKLGDYGRQVEMLQSLIFKRAVNIAVDGMFGQKTKEHAIKTQKEINITPDGVVRNGFWIRIM